MVLPSEWYEMFPIVVLEALANRVPVIASALGGLPELIEMGITGLLFAPGDPKDLAEKARWASVHAAEMLAMGEEGHRRWRHQYSGERNYEHLHGIYSQAIKRRTRLAAAHGLTEEDRPHLWQAYGRER